MRVERALFAQRAVEVLDMSLVWQGEDEGAGGVGARSEVLLALGEQLEGQPLVACHRSRVEAAAHVLGNNGDAAAVRMDRGADELCTEYLAVGDPRLDVLREAVDAKLVRARGESHGLSGRALAQTDLRSVRASTCFGGTGLCKGPWRDEGWGCCTPGRRCSGRASAMRQWRWAPMHTLEARYHARGRRWKPQR